MRSAQPGDERDVSAWQAQLPEEHRLCGEALGIDGLIEPSAHARPSVAGAGKRRPKQDLCFRKRGWPIRVSRDSW